MRHTKIFRKGLAVLLVFAMVVGILPGNRIAVNAEEESTQQNEVDISKGSIVIDSDTTYKRGEESYNFDKDSLVITGTNVSGAYVQVASTVNENIKIRLENVTLVAKENSAIENKGSGKLTIIVDGENYLEHPVSNKPAIYSKGDLKIEGTGNLKIVVPLGTGGIKAKNVDIGINGLDIDAMNGAAISATNGAAISANTVALKSSNGNSVYAQSGDIAISANTLAVTSNATLSSSAMGIYAAQGDVSISGTESVTIDASSSIGIYAAQGDVSINNTGDFTLNAEYDGISSYRGSIGISANMVEVTSQSGKAVFAGEYAGNIAISANKVALTSMNNAVYADGDVSFSGGEVFVERKEGSNSDYAIEANEKLTLSDTIKNFTVSSNCGGIKSKRVDAKAENIKIDAQGVGIKNGGSSLNIQNSSIEIISGEHGIHSESDVSIDTTSDVNITTRSNPGIYYEGLSDGKISVSTNNLTISAYGCGISSESRHKVDVAIKTTKATISSTNDRGINTNGGALTIDGGDTTIKGAYVESSALLKPSISAGTITVSPNAGQTVTVDIGKIEASKETIVDQETGPQSVTPNDLKDKSYFRAYSMPPKKEVMISGVTAVSTNLVYDGTAGFQYNKDALSVKEGENDITDTIKDKLEYKYISKDDDGYSSTTPPTDAGSYALKISVPSNNPTYKGSKEIPFTITKKAVTANVKSITVTQGQTPSYELAYEGLVGSDTITSDEGTAPEFEYRTDSEPEEWADVSSIDTSKTGTYKIRCKNTDSVKFTNTKNYAVTWATGEAAYGTLTVKEKPAPAPIIPSPSPIPSAPTENYNIPVKNENTVQIGAEIKEGKAEVSEITADTIGKVVNNKEESKVNTITIDLSGAKQEVKGVTLSKKSVEALAKATAEESNGIETATIELSKATVVLDNKTLETLVELAKGTQIELVVADTKQEILNSAQKTTLNKYQVATTFEAYFTSDGERIHDFKGGKAVVSIAFTPEEGKDTSYYHLVYLADDGAITRYRTRYESGKLMFTTTHFSDYAVIYDTGEKNDTGEEPEEEDKTDDGTGEEPKEEDKTDGTGEEPKEEDKTDGAGEEPKEEDKTDTAEKDDGSSTEIKITMDTTYQKLRLRIPTSTKTTNVLKWVRMEEADGYVIYGSKCNTRDETHKMVQKTVIKNGKTTTWTDKNLKKDTYYKYYIKAYKLVKGKKVWLAKSKVAHSTTTGGKYGNASSVKVNKTSVSLKVGKTAQIKAEQVVKNLLFKVHTQISFESSNSKVAAVTSGGVIKAKKKGTCYIYVYAQNGIYKRIKVTVK